MGYTAAGWEDRLPAFLHSLEREEEPLLAELRTYAEANGIPILRRETESFLRTLAVLRAPASILEIGTAIGYSAIVMAGACGASVVTLDNDARRIPAARENIRRAGLDGRIHVIETDAGPYLKEAAAEGLVFDLVFLDAAKGQYPAWLPDILKVMRPGSVLAADNVLQDLTVAESRYAVPRRERTTHARMRDFLYAVKHDPCLQSSVLPVGDGVSLTVKIS